ncbi:MAG TPA: hypothetical protein VGA80_05125 [Flavobacteriaceae bacterium]
MKHPIKIVILLLIIAGTVRSYGQDTKSYKVLFLGNSAFYSRGGLIPSFEGFCQSAGIDCQAFSQMNTPPNTLGVDFLNYGRIPKTLPLMSADDKIHALISSGNFDYVIIDGRDAEFLIPNEVEFPDDDRDEQIPYEQNIEALISLHRTIVKSGAKTVLYMHPGNHATVDIKHPLAQIYQRFHSDMEKTEVNNKRHKVILVPALFLWLDATKRYGVEKWYADAGHGSAIARYSSACLLYTYLTRMLSWIIRECKRYPISPTNKNQGVRSTEIEDSARP